MAILNKILNIKKKNAFDEALKAVLEDGREEVRLNYSLRLVEKLSHVPIEASFEVRSNAVEDFEKTYQAHPEAVHYTLSNGDNLITYAFKQRKLGLLFNAIKKVSLGEIAVAKHGEKEPLCFSLFESKNIKAIEDMNDYLKEYKINPKDASGNKWSDVYSKTIKTIHAKAKAVQDDFVEQAEKDAQETKYFNRILKR